LVLIAPIFVVSFFEQDIVVSENKDALPVNVPKQKSAFPPNYVHSLDSTHMQMTALRCRDLGIAYTAVHDR
jgi:DNA-directed RNA polymerase